MFNLLRKEMKLSASFISYLFILFGLMFLIPGYPILCSVFFVTLGIFQSYQNARETNDILFSVLLPVEKKEVVKGKYLFTCFIELCSISLMIISVILRMTVFAEDVAYRKNMLMNANLFALGVAFSIFGVFHIIFIRGFFKTAYKFAKPFGLYIMAVFLMIGMAETLHHIPGLKVLNAFGFEYLDIQIGLFLIGLVMYVLLTMISYRSACKSFEKIDL